MHTSKEKWRADKLYGYSSSVGSRWKRPNTASTKSCTPSRAASSVSATGPAMTGTKEAEGSWLRKHVKTYSIANRQSLLPSASKRAPRIRSRRQRRSAVESSTGSASEMDAGRTSVGMGLTPNGTNAVLASPAQAVMRWAPARCSARRSSSVFLITSTAWGPEPAASPGQLALPGTDGPAPQVPALFPPNAPFSPQLRAQAHRAACSALPTSPP
jgi:hypothetical protein